MFGFNDKVRMSKTIHVQHPLGAGSPGGLQIWFE
jgi:hypothetical protein